VANLIVSAVSTFDNKGLKKGQKEISAFDKQVTKLGKTFAGVFGARALFNYSKNAINAFAADEKAAKSLELQLRNTGYAFSAPSVEKYIAGLQDLYGVLDDDLRPAFQQLLTVTGSITRSQNALDTALNVSAATGKSLTEVSAALSRGFAGNTTGLSRLGAGLSKATLKTGDMDKILGELNTKFAGQAAARLDTYAGKMDQLQVASANAAETIGKSLLDALSAISKEGTISSLSTQINDVATSVSYLITGIGELSRELQNLAKIKIPTPGGGGWLDFILRNAPVVSAYYNAGKTKQTANQPAKETPAMGRIAAQQRKLELAALKNSVALRKAENDQLSKKTEVDKLKDKFDLERIGLAAALNYNISAEDKLRVNALTAIANNNEALAKKYNAELDAAEKARLLAEAMAKAAAAATSFPAFAMGAVQRGEYSDVYKNISNVPSGGGGGYSPIPTPSFNMGAVQRGEYITINNQFAGSLLTDQDLTNTINETILRINKMGRGTTPAGGLSGGT
jgi:hypothetical protein